MRRDADNLQAVGGLLGELGAVDSRRRSLGTVLESLAGGGTARLKTRLGGFDVMSEIPAEGDFSWAALSRRSEVVRIGRRDVRVASLRDLIAMKERAHRVKDLARLPELRRISRLQARQRRTRRT